MRFLMLRPLAASVAFSMMASTVRADAISSYTVTDLGPDTVNYTLSSTGANGTLITASGTVYAFPRTDNLVANPQSLLATFPPLNNAPSYIGGYAYDNPNNVYSYLDTNNVF